MAKVIDEAAIYLNPEIVTGKDNLVFHSEWDNLKLDKLYRSKIFNQCGGNHVVRTEKRNNLFS